MIYVKLNPNRRELRGRRTIGKKKEKKFEDDEGERNARITECEIEAPRRMKYPKDSQHRRNVDD